MNKGLEALERIKNKTIKITYGKDDVVYYRYGDYLSKEDLVIIETELKEKEKQCEILRIIKEKKVDTDSLFAIWTMKNVDDGDCLKFYNNPRTIYGKQKLTQAEFDLLKERFK